MANVTYSTRPSSDQSPLAILLPSLYHVTTGGGSPSTGQDNDIFWLRMTLGLRLLGSTLLPLITFGGTVNS
jgi:hypothetical protein